MAAQKVNIGIVGFGTVGQGTAKILLKEKNNIIQKTGIDFNIKKIAELNTDIKTDFDIDASLFTKDYKELIADKDIGIIVELIGGKTIAYNVIHEALKGGKHVVTANKALLAEKGNELFGYARENDRIITFEAAVGGGIPVIKALQYGLSANRIKSIVGILNGTANYILTKMRYDKISFEEALSQAKEMGFAEQDPTFDIEGIDTAHKISLLASLAFGEFYNLNQISTEGISKIKYTDIKYAEEMGYVIKLIALAYLSKSNIPSISVGPAFIPKDSTLAQVNYEYNGVFIEGDSVGHTLYTGKGAGSLPTGSAVVSDIIHTGIFVQETAKYIKMYPKGSKGDVCLFDDTESEYYVRLAAVDKPGVLSQISKVFGENNISIAGLRQTQTTEKGHALIVVNTHKTQEKAINRVSKQINDLGIVTENVIKIKIIKNLYNFR